MMPERSYTIAFSPRSGSSELCNLLARNGLGAPTEYFQSPPDAQWILAVVRDNTRNGVFGSKMAHDHRARVDGLLRQGGTGCNGWDDFLPNHRWVWLMRRDKIAQAISACRAERTGIWSSVDRARRSSPDPDFDYHFILSRIMILSVGDIAWESYFHSRNISPYIIYYEDLFSRLQASLSDLIEYLGGLPAGHRRVDLDATLSVQRDETSSEWYQRFAHYLAAVGDIDMVAEFGDAHVRWTRFFERLASPGIKDVLF